ncbi:MAG: hypothetical protein JW827_12360 [Spirochaetes bacterium]|nr:hypothetical protein [Spirochaetota bacterium]
MKASQIIFLFLCLVISVPSPFWGQQIPYDKDFKEITSTHFTVVYHGHKNIAQRVIIIAENIHASLASRFFIEDSIHTYIVLADVTDMANGMATVLPDNIIYLYDITPQISAQKSLLHYDQWLEELILHEYVHILHLNQDHSMWKILRSLGLKYIVPNALLPLSSLEGLAVAIESYYTPMGRAKSSFKDMVLRTAVYEDNVPALDEISAFVNKIPSGYGPYIWGGSFHYYLIHKVSENNVLKAYNRHGGCLNCLLSPLETDLRTCACSVLSCSPLNAIFYLYTDQSYYDLYDEWTAKITKDYLDEIRKINKPTKPFKLSGIEPFWNIYDLKYYDHKIYFSGYSPHTGYGLYAYDLKEKELTILLEDAFVSSLTFFNDEIFFTGFDIYDNVYSYFSLYRYDTGSGRRKRIKNTRRMVYVEKYQDDLLVLENSENKKRLFIMSTDGQRKEIVLEFGKYDIASDFKLIKDDLYFIMKKENDFIDIYQYQFQTKDLKRITRTASMELSLMVDNENLYFVSDHNSRFDLYRYHVIKKDFYQLTDLITGSLQFAASGNDFYLTYYTSSGFKMAVLNEKKMKKIPVDYNKNDSYPHYLKEETIHTAESDHKDKGSFSSLGNLFSQMILFPDFYAYSEGQSYFVASFGLTLLFTDILMKNSLSICLGYDTYVEDYYGRFNYYLKNNKIDLDIQAFRLYAGRTNQLKKDEYISAGIQYLKNTILDLLAFHTGLAYYKRDMIYNRRVEYYNSLFAGFTYNNTKKYPYSIIPEKGWHVYCRYDLLKEFLGSSYDLDLFNLRITKYNQLFFMHDIFRIFTDIGIMLNDSGDEPYEVEGLSFNKSTLYTKRLMAYSYYEKSSKNYFIANISYNFPLFWIERGIKNMPLLLSHVWMKLYYEGGNGFNDIKKLSLMDMVGADLNFSLYFYYSLKTDISFGVSYELEKRRNYNLYITGGIKF